MSHLRPCSGCARHVRANATACPFCAASLEVETTPPAMPQERLGRAARMAFGGATVVALTVGAGCGKSARDPNENVVMPYGAPPNPGRDGGPDENIMMPYGAPPTPRPDAATSPLATAPEAGAPDAGPAAGAGKLPPPKLPRPANVNKPYGAPPADGYDVFTV